MCIFTKYIYMFIYIYILVIPSEGSTPSTSDSTRISGAFRNGTFSTGIPMKKSRHMSSRIHVQKNMLQQPPKKIRKRNKKPPKTPFQNDDHFNMFHILLATSSISQIIPLIGWPIPGVKRPICMERRIISSGCPSFAVKRREIEVTKLRGFDLRIDSRQSQQLLTDLQFE